MSKLFSSTRTSSLQAIPEVRRVFGTRMLLAAGCGAIGCVAFWVGMSPNAIAVLMLCAGAGLVYMPTEWIGLRFASATPRGDDERFPAGRWLRRMESLGVHVAATRRWRAPVFASIAVAIMLSSSLYSPKSGVALTGERMLADPIYAKNYEWVAGDVFTHSTELHGYLWAPGGSRVWVQDSLSRLNFARSLVQSAAPDRILFDAGGKIPWFAPHYFKAELNYEPFAALSAVIGEGWETTQSDVLIRILKLDEIIERLQADADTLTLPEDPERAPQPNALRELIERCLCTARSERNTLQFVFTVAF